MNNGVPFQKLTLSYVIVQEVVYLERKKLYDDWDGTARSDDDEIPEVPKRPSLSAYLNSMRNNSPDLFRQTVQMYLPICCGKKLWDKEKATADKTISQIVSISDEAMLFMVLENCWEHWRLVGKHR